MKKRLAYLLMCVPTLLSAKVTLPSIFSDGMVLQQKTNVKIWGQADSKDVVTMQLSWSGQNYTAVPDKQGNWCITIPTKAADFKPYSITINHGGQVTSLSDVLFGEVWLCSGQSNMEMKMRGWYGSAINGGREAIANSRNEYIRYFTVEKKLSDKEKEDCNGIWTKATPTNVAMSSATAYFFGRQLYQTLNVPVALIASHWGGAAICAFMSNESIKNFPEYTKALETINTKNLGIGTPTAIYNSMIHPIAGYAIKGTIWYQGETDKHIPDLYRKLFHTMLTDWRTRWGVGDFPFIYAQIAPFDYPNWDGNSAYIREAQFLCQQENTNAYMISLTDIGEEHNIHPAEKEQVGLRMAFRALDKVYNVEGICSDEPYFKSIEVKENKATITFENADKGLFTYGKELSAFTIAGSDRVFYPAVATLVPWQNKVVVYSEKVSHPVAVRYAFTDFAKGTLYNIEGCCAPSFRTDNWNEKDCKFID